MKNLFEDFQKELSKKIEKLREDIYKRCGEEFNINSPAQLQKVLFEKLKLHEEIEDKGELKKLKTGGYSTSAGELLKLRGSHPVIDNILKYRELTKLKNTYVDALPKLVNKDTGRIHTSFNQAITATGRLSSSDPNLQNIPIRTEEGRKLREAFVAEKGKKLISVDYSQIELRIMAQVSGDENMKKAFKNDGDIHTATAAKIYKVEEKGVDYPMRRNAKAVNFGILYGVSPYGLKQSTGLSYE